MTMEGGRKKRAATDHNSGKNKIPLLTSSFTLVFFFPHASSHSKPASILCSHCLCVRNSEGKISSETFYKKSSIYDLPEVLRNEISQRVIVKLVFEKWEK